jgi:hypothetical protein
MEKPMVDALAERLDKLERENRRWKRVAGLTALAMTLSLTLGGLLGSRAVVAQQPAEKAGSPALRHMEYKVTEVVPLHQMGKPLQAMDAEGWELVQIVPTGWRTSGQGLAGQAGGGAFDRGIIVARRPMVPAR